MIFRKFLESGDRLPPKAGGGCQITTEHRSAPAQRPQIDLLVIRFAVLPASEDDANPFVRQASDRRLVRLLVLPEMLIIRLGPLRLSDRVKRKLVKGLPQKLRASPTEMDPTGLPAGFLH